MKNREKPGKTNNKVKMYFYDIESSWAANIRLRIAAYRGELAYHLFLLCKIKIKILVEFYGIGTELYFLNIGYVCSK